jgi:hypothetical protein
MAAMAAAAALGTVAGSASAHGDDVERPAPPRGREGELVYVPPPPPPPPPPDGEEPPTRFGVGLEMVLGWGKVPFAVQNLPVTGNQAITYSRADGTSSNVQSFVASADVQVTRHSELGLRVPFAFAGFTPDGAAARSTVGLGNVELEGDYQRPIGPGLRFLAALQLALPTAQGDEIPVGLSNASALGVDATAFDRWSMARAAMLSRGYEDNALFAPHRFGIVPRFGLLYRSHGFSVEPYVKVENLVAAQTTLSQSYVGDLVAGLRVGYWVQKQFELALRGWVNVGFAGADADKTTAAGLEPLIVLRFGPVRPFAGVVIPLAGPPKDASFVGVRLGLEASF